MNPSTVPSAVTLLAGHVLPLPPFTSESLVFLFGFFEVIIIVVVGMANQHAIHEYSICILQFAICIRLVLWRRSHTHTRIRNNPAVLLLGDTTLAKRNGKFHKHSRNRKWTYARKDPANERYVREEGPRK